MIVQTISNISKWVIISTLEDIVIFEVGLSGLGDSFASINVMVYPFKDLLFTWLSFLSLLLALLTRLVLRI